jgi:uncharacterized delta-60 repeat protein
MFVARFNADGTLDSSFGTAGTRIQDVTSGSDCARNLVLLPDGSMIAAGEPIATQTVHPTGVLKLDTNGNAVAAFGSNGRVSISTSRVARGLALQADGKLLLAGRSIGSPGLFELMRLNADGSLDTGFGTGGLVSTSLSQSTSGEGDHALAVALRPDGRIYVAGHSGSINRNFALARYTTTGALDTSFAGTGVVSVDFNGLNDGAESIAIQGDGRIVLGGFATPTSTDGYALMRINP